MMYYPPGGVSVGVGGSDDGELSPHTPAGPRILREPSSAGVLLSCCKPELMADELFPILEVTDDTLAALEVSWDALLTEEEEEAPCAASGESELSIEDMALLVTDDADSADDVSDILEAEDCDDDTAASSCFA